MFHGVEIRSYRRDAEGYIYIYIYSQIWTLIIADFGPDACSSYSSMPSQQYLVVFAQAHEDFRDPELRSIAELHGFPLGITDDFDSSRPFGVLTLEREVHVRLLARRCILIK